jgi:hypothetical protein
LSSLVHLDGSVPISGPSLFHFFQESQDNLRKCTLKNMTLHEEQIRALATTEFLPGMELILHGCSLLGDNGCNAAFVECLQGDRGPTQLVSCSIEDCHVIAAALEGNSRVTLLQRHPASTADDAAKGVIFRSLAVNKGLVKLDLFHRSISEENWTIMCESVKGHPTLTSLYLGYTSPRALNGNQIEMSTEQRAQRTRVLAAIVRENRVLLTIDLRGHERDDQIYEESILPYLETNLYRPRVLLSIKKADSALRRPLLGLALQTESVRNKSNLLWMFLSGNQDVVLQSDEEDSGQVVEVAVSAPVEIAAIAPLVVEASSLVDVAARAQEEQEATPK